MSWKQAINGLWRRYNATLLRIVAPFPTTTLFDPYFLYQHHFNRNLRALARHLEGTVVDVGCGQKPYEKFFSSARYLGVDLPHYSGGLLDAQPRAEVFGDGGALPFRSGAVEGVVALQVLEHTPRPAAVIAEAHRVLKSDGRFLVSVPQSYPIHGEPHDYYRYTAYGIRYLLEHAGFKVESVLPNGSFGSYIGLMINKYFFQHFFEFRPRYATRMLFGALKIVLTPVLLVGIFLVNIGGLLLDAMHADPYFTSNYTVLARK